MASRTGRVDSCVVQRVTEHVLESGEPLVAARVRADESLALCPFAGADAGISLCASLRCDHDSIILRLSVIHLRGIAVRDTDCFCARVA